MQTVKFFCCLLMLSCAAVASGSTKILNSRGQVTGSVKVVGSTYYFRDAQGRYSGRATVQVNRVIQYDHRGIRK